nr:MAG TPA: hypothetical protein [Caudoviricetes sp.]
MIRYCESYLLKRKTDPTLLQRYCKIRHSLKLLRNHLKMLRVQRLMN